MYRHFKQKRHKNLSALTQNIVSFAVQVIRTLCSFALVVVQNQSNINSGIVFALLLKGVAADLCNRLRAVRMLQRH